jgi:hypothetical protein
MRRSIKKGERGFVRVCYSPAKCPDVFDLFEVVNPDTEGFTSSGDYRLVHVKLALEGFLPCQKY